MLFKRLELTMLLNTLHTVSISAAQ